MVTLVSLSASTPIRVSAGYLGGSGKDELVAVRFAPNGSWNQWSTGGGCDMVAVAPYLRNPALQPEDLEKRKDYFREMKAIAETYGVEVVCYEGGTQNNQMETWQRSEDCYDVYNGFLHFLADSIGVNVFYALDLVGNPNEFGHIDSLEQALLEYSLQPPKWRAIMDVNTREPLTLFDGSSITWSAKGTAHLCPGETAGRPALHMFGMYAPSGSLWYALSGRRIQSSSVATRTPGGWMVIPLSTR